MLSLICGTGEHFLVRRRAKNGSKAFSLLLCVEFSEALRYTAARHGGGEGVAGRQVLPFAPVGRLTADCFDWPILNIHPITL